MGPWVASKIPPLSPRASGFALSPWAAGWYFWYHPRAHMVLWQFQCSPKNDLAVVFLHSFLNRQRQQRASISHKKLHFPMQTQGGIAKVLQNSFVFTEKIVAIPRVCKGFSSHLISWKNSSPLCRLFFKPCSKLLHDHFEGCIEIANPKGLKNHIQPWTEVCLQVY